MVNPSQNQIESLTGLYNSGQTKEALQACTELLRIYPQSLAVLEILGLILAQHGKLRESVRVFDKIINLKPDYAEIYCNRGIVLKAIGELEAALSSYNQAIQLKPNYAEAYNNRGNLLKDIGQTKAALANYNQAIQLNPSLETAHSNRGIALKEIGQLEAALSSYNQAIQLKPNYAEAYNNRGNLLKEMKQLEEASDSYDQATKLDPNYAEAYNNRGNVLLDLARMEEAVKSYEQASLINGKYTFSWQLVLPAISASHDSIHYWRSRYQDGIKLLRGKSISPDSLTDINPNSFYLAYHNLDDRPIMEDLCQLFRSKISSITFTSPHLSNWDFLSNPIRRIRIGFLSHFLRDSHTIGKLYRGFLLHLDRSRFEVVLIHIQKKKPDIIDTIADKVIFLPNSLVDQQKMVAEEALDVLFYPDIGMSSATYFLAHSRLAPVQAVSWGHPNTTGIDTMDYFISSDRIEPEQAQTYYSERLIRLNRLPCFYQRPLELTQIPVRSELGLPESGTLYGCPQTLFKFHPDFDSVLAQIITEDPDGYIILIEGNIPVWEKLLKKRWSAAHSLLIDRVIFLAQQPIDRFMALISHFDVLLDPIHFGGGNTMYEAMVYGKPFVTWPGKFMRGRVATGAYNQMRIEDAPIVDRIEDYAPLAVTLGKDCDRRQELIRSSLRGTKNLFSDIMAVRQFEDFLEAAVTSASQGRLLPQTWAPQQENEKNNLKSAVDSITQATKTNLG